MIKFNVRETIAAGVIAGVAATAINLAGAPLVPVAVFVEASAWEVDEYDISARFYGYKIRDCEYVSEQGYVKFIDTRAWSEEVLFEFVEDDTPGSSRPIGKHDFGRWKWKPYSRAAAGTFTDQVLLVVTHLCGGDRYVTTKIGPFRVQHSK